MWGEGAFVPSLLGCFTFISPRFVRVIPPFTIDTSPKSFQEPLVGIKLCGFFQGLEGESKFNMGFGEFC